MKQTLFTLALVLSLTTCSYSNPPEPLVIGYNEELLNSVYWNDKTSNQGIDAEILRTLFQRSNLNYEIKFEPWSRLIHQVETGAIASICPGFKTPERESFAVYLKEPLNYSTFSIFTKRGKEFVFEGLKDLHGKRIGVNLGYSISPDITNKKHKSKISIIELYTSEANLKALVNDRIDAYAGNRDSTLFIVKKSGLSDKVTCLTHPISAPRPVYLMFSKIYAENNNHTTIMKLNRTLEKMWKDNIIKKIVSKYTTSNLAN